MDGTNNMATKTCTSCGGTGQTYFGSTLSSCNTCAGTGSCYVADPPYQPPTRKRSSKKATKGADPQEGQAESAIDGSAKRGGGITVEGLFSFVAMCVAVFLAYDANVQWPWYGWAGMAAAVLISVRALLGCFPVITRILATLTLMALFIYAVFLYQAHS